MVLFISNRGKDTNLSSIILYALRNSIANLGKAPLQRLIGINQAEVTPHRAAIGLALSEYSL